MFRIIIIYIPNAVLYHKCYGTGVKTLEEGVQKCGPQIPGIRDEFPADPRLHFCNGYFKVYLFFKLNE
jgi:hypothetical protein